MLTSTTALPATAWADLGAISDALVNGMARTTSSAEPAASAFGGGDAGAGDAAALAGILGIARSDDDVVAGPREGGGQGCADVAGSDDRDVHGGLTLCSLDELVFVKRYLLTAQP